MNLMTPKDDGTNEFSKKMLLWAQMDSEVAESPFKATILLHLLQPRQSTSNNSFSAPIVFTTAEGLFWVIFFVYIFENALNGLGDTSNTLACLQGAFHRHSESRLAEMEMKVVLGFLSPRDWMEDVQKEIIRDLLESSFPLQISTMTNEIRVAYVESLMWLLQNQLIRSVVVEIDNSPLLGFAPISYYELTQFGEKNASLLFSNRNTYPNAEMRFRCFQFAETLLITLSGLIRDQLMIQNSKGNGHKKMK